MYTFLNQNYMFIGDVKWGEILNYDDGIFFYSYINKKGYIAIRYFDIFLDPEAMV